MFHVIKEIPFGPVRHIKTGRRYYFVRTAIDATNGRGDKEVAVYYNEQVASVLYVRDLEEFFEGFEQWDVTATNDENATSGGRG